MDWKRRQIAEQALADRVFAAESWRHTSWQFRRLGLTLLSRVLAHDHHCQPETLTLDQYRFALANHVPGTLNTWLAARSQARPGLLTTPELAMFDREARWAEQDEAREEGSGSASHPRSVP